MPRRPPHKCNKFGCTTLTNERFCEKHHQERRLFDDVERESASRRGYDRTWQKARLRYLRANPFCSECIKKNKRTVATVVDHVVPHKMDRLAFWDEDNWQSLCAQCHNKKTLREINHV